MKRNTGLAPSIAGWRVLLTLADPVRLARFAKRTAALPLVALKESVMRPPVVLALVAVSCFATAPGLMSSARGVDGNIKELWVDPTDLRFINRLKTKISDGLALPDGEF